MEIKKKLTVYWPLLVVLIVSIGYVAYRLAKYELDPVGIAEIGTKFSQADPEGTEGYDGQFAYYVAMEPDPSKVVDKLDVPAYRYQRILYPLIARVFALGNPDWIPWTLILINLLSLWFVTWMMIRYLNQIDVPGRYVLIIGLWAGLVVGIGTDLYEPLAFAMVVASWYARLNQRSRLGYLLLSLALLTKEVMIAFWLAAALADIWKNRTRADWIAILAPGGIFLLWQAWLWGQFGSPGITSGGAMATPFELFPFFGFIRIGTVSWKVLLLFSLFFGPTIIVPSIWGTLSSLKTLLNRKVDATGLALLINSLFLVFLPFSTFREPSGLLRVATGMVFAILLYAGHFRLRRVLNYSMFWIFLLVILIPQ